MSRRSYIRIPADYLELDSITTTSKAAFKLSYNPSTITPGFDIIWKYDSGMTALNTEIDPFGIYTSSGYTYWLFFRRPSGHASTPNKNFIKFTTSSGTPEYDTNYSYDGSFKESSLINGTFTDCLGTKTTGIANPRSGSYYGYIGVGAYWNGSSQAFATRSGNTYKIYIKYLALYSGVNKVYELIPCMRVSDGKIGMYDLVNKAFHSSETGTEFEKG